MKDDKQAGALDGEPLSERPADAHADTHHAAGEDARDALGVHHDEPPTYDDGQHDPHEHDLDDDLHEYDEHALGDPDRPRKPASKGHHAVLAAAAAIVLVGLIVVWQVAAPVFGSLFGSKDFDGPGSGAVTVVVNPGDSGRAIGETLERAGVVKTSGAFEDALTSTQGPEIQPGTYRLRSEMKATDAVTALRNRDSRNVMKVTIREGLWKNEVFAALSKATGHPISEYQAAEKAAKAAPADFGLPPSAKGNIEGYLYPATYSFEPKTPPADQLKELIGHATNQLRSLGVAPERMEHVVTVASIIDNEARHDVDRPKIARVIENRLAKKVRLELDSTVSYGVQRRGITTTDAERAQKNGYNTYVHDGLPVGPIGNPGAASIKAAQQPAAGPWMFFVAVNPETGETRYGTTPAEHEANVKQFQAWCQAHPGKC